MQIFAPTHVPWEPLEKALANRARIRSELAVASEDVKEAERKLQRAQDEDQEALAAAALEGKPSSGKAAAVRKAEEGLGEAKRRASALAVAAPRADEDVVRVVNQNRGEWTSDADALVEEKRAHAREVAVQMAAALAEVEEALTLRTFLARPGKRSPTLKASTRHAEAIEAVRVALDPPPREEPKATEAKWSEPRAPRLTGGVPVIAG